MAQGEHYVGVDVGTGSARACIIDANGEIKATVSKDIQTWEPRSGYYEQSTTDIWACISFCVKAALVQGAVDPTSVRGIGFCATCSLAVLSSKTDAPISVSGPKFDKPEQNVILWLDHRPVAEAEVINATDDPVLKYVGGQMSVEMEIPKILWLKRNMPRELWGDCKDGATAFFDSIGLGEFKTDGYAKLGGINGHNGTFLSAGSKIGTLSPHAATDLGLPIGTAVGSGVIDAYAGWIGTVGAKHNLLPPSGQGVFEAVGRLALVAGTSTCHLTLSPDPHFVQGVWGPYRDVLSPGLWMTEGGQSATGKLLTYVLETHPAYPEVLILLKTDATHGNIYNFLNSHLVTLAESTNSPDASIPHMCRHFHYYGDLFGNRSPLADPSMTGSIIGLTADGRSIDSLALHYYGVLEFLALQTRHIIDALSASGIPTTSLYMSGSQCQNALLMRLMADVCAMPVWVPLYVNAAVVHGAAMLGAKAATETGEGGQSEDLWGIMERMSKPGSVVLPGGNAREKGLFDVKYEIFLEQAEGQRRVRKKVEDAVKGW
ncbi:hypothetical protein V502_01968 [Pseudogymnoascus sp. VKM F-4520 (FW-2644)]|nr:hypothetical protein V502_01968 [Pseudogymnoascus sp. VKM F-4520 (FW-2644)]